MTTSGVSSYNPDFDEIITEAYERCGVQVRDGYDVLSARRSLNLMFAEWANRGLNLYTIEQREVVLVANTFEYTLPSDTVDVLSAVIRTNSGASDQQDITIDRIGSAEYLHTPNKLTASRPAQFYVQRTVPAKLFLYPAPDSTQSYIFRYYGIRRIEETGAVTNTADISFRFLPCLTSGLAYYLAVKKAPDRIVMLKQFYEEEFARAASEDRERSSYFAVPTYTESY